MDSSIPSPTYCSDYSLSAGEPLIGSATQTDGYILIEYNEAWGEKALEMSSIPQPVKDHLKAFGKSHPTVKTLLVRSPHPVPDLGLRCFIGVANERQPAIYTFPMASYDNLLSLDLPAILAEDPGYRSYRRSQPMFLVCTNGRRDVCCARRGVPVLNALLALTQDSPEPLVWHSSHMGGHRFAANFLCLPHGLLYGRVELEQAGAILEAYRQERISLLNLRGRTCYPPAVQAAEHFLRQQTGQTSLEAMFLLKVHQSAPDQWAVYFFSETSGETYDVQVRAIETGSRVFESCHMDKTTPVIRYEFSYNMP